MSKLPDNDTLRRFYREGLSDKEIAQAYGCSVQAVNARYTAIGIERKPYSNIAAAILEAAWPREEFDRGSSLDSTAPEISPRIYAGASETKR